MTIQANFSDPIHTHGIAPLPIRSVIIHGRCARESYRSFIVCPHKSSHTFIVSIRRPSCRHNTNAISEPAYSFSQ